MGVSSGGGVNAWFLGPLSEILVWLLCHHLSRWVLVASAVRLRLTFFPSEILMRLQCTHHNFYALSAAGTWVDVAPLLPSAFTAADAAALLELSPPAHLQGKTVTGRGTTGISAAAQPAAAKAGTGGKAAVAAAAGGAGAHVLAATCVVSPQMWNFLEVAVEEAVRSRAAVALAARKASGVGASSSNQVRPVQTLPHI